MRFPSLLLFLLYTLFPMMVIADDLVIFVPQAKLRENPEFSAKVITTVAEGTSLTATGEIHQPNSDEGYPVIIDESWSQVEFEGKTL